MFDTEFNFFIENQERLVQQHGGKVLVIEGKSIAGVFETAGEAFENLKSENRLGKAMIQPCLPGRDAFTISVASVGVVA
jgi:hypothetical protein